MVWKTFQRVGRFVQSRPIGIITASTTVVVGLVMYEKLKEEKVAHAYYRPDLSDATNNRETPKTLSSSKTGIKWDENWDK